MGVGAQGVGEAVAQGGGAGVPVRVVGAVAVFRSVRVGVTVVMTMPSSVAISAVIRTAFPATVMSAVVRVVVRAQVRALGVDVSLHKAYGDTSTALQPLPSYTL